MLGSHTAQAMFEGFTKALTSKTSVLPAEEMLTEREVFEKTSVFVADGASSMGVRQKGATPFKQVDHKCRMAFDCLLKASHHVT